MKKDSVSHERPGRVTAGIYAAYPLEKDSQFFGIGRHHEHQLCYSMTWNRFLQNDKDSKIQFSDTSSHEKVHETFWSKMKEFSSKKEGFVYDYVIGDLNNFSEESGLEISDIACIVRDGIKEGIIPSNGQVVMFPGVLSWFMYIGSSGSMFAIHREDMKLYSINYLKSGAPKVWYIVPPEFYEKTLFLAKQDLLASGETEVNCPSWEMHKSFIMDPEWFDKHGIPLYQILQRPGQAVMVHPLTLHFGFNCGINDAFATNFGIPDWLPYAAGCGIVSVSLFS